MDRGYWEKVSANYEGEVHSVFDHDVKGLVRERIKGAGKLYPAGQSADFGCGVGKFTLAMAGAFGRVMACDLSEKGLEATRERCSAVSNVSYKRLDLGRDELPYGLVDFALCVNVLIMPSMDERRRVWRAVTNQVAPGGRLLLVIPSAESAQLGYHRSVEACLSEGDSCDEAQRRSGSETLEAGDLLQGVYPLDGLLTKHYLKEELADLLREHEFEVEEIRKIEYEAEKDESAGVSWDWLALAVRRG